MEKKVLGKGLSALISSKPSEGILEKEISSLEINPQGDVTYLKIMSILKNPFQPRKDYDESKLAELKVSIKEKGVLQPLLVRKHKDNYELIAGERRLRAARAVGLDEVPVIIRNVTDREALVLALVENIQREELNAIEEAQGFKRLIEEFQFSQEEVAQAVGKDRSSVANLLRLLKLPEEIQQHVIDGKISMGHARALINLENIMIQRKMAEAIINKGLSVRQIEDLTNKAKQAFRAVPGKRKNRDIEILEEELEKILGTKVSLKDRKGRGKLIVEYYSLDDLDRILGILRK
jgi:ParB family chromosome partitioning protein